MKKTISFKGSPEILIRKIGKHSTPFINDLLFENIQSGKIMEFLPKYLSASEIEDIKGILNIQADIKSPLMSKNNNKEKYKESEKIRFNGFDS